MSLTKKLRRVALILLFAAAAPGAAFADSDGYYCIGRDYLAYQFGMAPSAVGPHRLSVIRTGEPSGIPEPAALELPQFQVHGMRCGEGWVELAAFTAVYHVTLDKNGLPIRYEIQPIPDGETIPKSFVLAQSQNLGALGGGRAYAQPIHVQVHTRERGGGYRLEIVAKPVPPLINCEFAIVSRLIETDRNGREINARILFEGRGQRECRE